MYTLSQKTVPVLFFE